MTLDTLAAGLAQAPTFGLHRTPVHALAHAHVAPLARGQHWRRGPHRIAPRYLSLVGLNRIGLARSDRALHRQRSRLLGTVKRAPRLAPRTLARGLVAR